MTDDTAKIEEAPGIGIDRHRADEAIYQPFNPGPIQWTRGEDGLPAVAPTDLPIVPPLTPETMVCMADRSQFVQRDSRWGEILATFEPSEVTRAPGGGYYVELAQMEGKLAPELLELVKAEAIADPRSMLRFKVEPIRPQCKFLARQMVDFQDAAENQMIERLCTARRDSESFFLSVRDQQVHACELREPRDALTELRLDRFDDAKVKLGKQRYQPGGALDVDRAIAKTEAEADKGLVFGGIFKE